ncbi:MAG: hypothetical protein K0R92_522 [Lachnospiraceae bacterium]|jgi:hypothetical protein|nr:hypothetical protein [Lachnospiraceae bacterium]
MEERIKTFIETAISNNTIPVLPDAVPGIIPCVTFHFYYDGGAVYGSGVPTEETASCQIDFWYYVKSSEILKAIKDTKQAIISEKTFSNPIKDNLFENDKKLHHTYFTFELIKESEE